MSDPFIHVLSSCVEILKKLLNIHFCHNNVYKIEEQLIQDENPNDYILLSLEGQRIKLHVPYIVLLLDKNYMDTGTVY